MNKYMVFEINKIGEKRLMIRTKISKQAYRIVAQLKAKNAEFSYVIEIDVNGGK